MSAIITSKFRYANAQNFKNSFGIASEPYYMFIGRSRLWADEGNPPVPVDSISSETYHHRDILSAKGVSSSDVEYVIPRRNWTSGTMYDHYSHDVSAAAPSDSGKTSLWESYFFIKTSLNRVYVCIWNNGGGLSTVEPSHTSTANYQTSDGYIWRFCYEITSVQVQKHLSLDFMPVSDATPAGVVSGAIDFVKLISSGTGYNNGTHTLPIVGDGTGGTVSMVVSSGTVDTVTISNAGSGYTFASIDPSGQQGAGGTDHNLKVIIPPIGGHGVNNKINLGAFFIMVNTTLSGEEGAGDFQSTKMRQVGLIKTPHTASVPSTGSTLSCVNSITLLMNSGTFIEAETITSSTSGASASVVSFVPALGSSPAILKYVQQSEIGSGLASDGTMPAFQTSETITGTTSGASGTSQTLNGAELDPYSGDILYIENRMPIPRATDQSENIKLIVEF